MPRFPGFLGGSNTSQSFTADAERTANLYIERTQNQSAKSPAGLFLIPGFQLWAASGADVGGRGFVFDATDQRLFGMMGARLSEWSSTGMLTPRDALVQDANPAPMIYNGVVGGQLGICTGGSVYSFNLGTNTLGGPHLAGGYTHLAYVDGYGVAFNPTTGKVNLSGLNDLSTWSAGTFFRRSKFPDPWQAMFVDTNSLLWLVGTDTYEVWSNQNPSSTQPFAPLSGLYGRYGIVAPFAYWVSSLGVGWIARSGPEGGASVITTRGSTPDVISTYAVNTALSGYRQTSRITDAEAVVYHEAGHTFVNLNFPSADATWTVDLEQRSWAERGQWNALNGRYSIWAPRAHIDAFGKHLIGERTSGKVLELRNDVFTDIDGNGIRWLRRSPGLTDEHKRIPLTKLEFLMDVGVAGQNVDPLAMLRLSDDGGRSFGNEHQASLGKVGKYRQRVTFNRLGAPQDFVAELSGTATAPVRIVDAYINNTEDVR